MFQHRAVVFLGLVMTLPACVVDGDYSEGDNLRRRAPSASGDSAQTPTPSDMAMTPVVDAGMSVEPDQSVPMPPPISCGDTRCNGEETCVSCPEDCGDCPSSCGDSACDDGETCRTCPQDCGDCDPCGNSVCEPGEDCNTCPQDCGRCDTCGDDTCDAGETCDNCPWDCGICRSCGDGRFTADESCAGCPEDCGQCPTCGDGFCRAEDGEDCLSCAADCDVCPSCGDGECDAESESCFLCPADCGNCAGCGNRVCDGNEDCSSCREDCGVCSVCGNGVCEGDDFETCVNCPADCGQCPVASCREIVGCVFSCFDLGSRPPAVSLACIGECTARGCADVQFFVDEVVSCAIGNIGAAAQGGGFASIFAVCSDELEACYQVTCPPSP